MQQACSSEGGMKWGVDIFLTASGRGIPTGL